MATCLHRRTCFSTVLSSARSLQWYSPGKILTLGLIYLPRPLLRWLRLYISFYLLPNILCKVTVSSIMTYFRQPLNFDHSPQSKHNQKINIQFCFLDLFQFLQRYDEGPNVKTRIAFWEIVKLPGKIGPSFFMMEMF